MDNLGAFLFISIAVALVSWVAWMSSRQERKQLEGAVKKMRAEISDLKSANASLETQLSQKRKSKTAGKKAKPPGKKEASQKKAPEPIIQVDEPAAPKVSPPVIVTRTGDANGRAIDTWESERTWTKSELAQLLDLYNNGLSVRAMAKSLNLDSKDIVYCIARQVFLCSGDLEEKTMAINDGLAWTTLQRNRVGALMRSGRSIRSIAEEYGRTEIAIVWQAIDNGFTIR
jgi:hypothetical protein